MRFTIAPRLLDHFGIAMYSSATKALAELCANAYDADATLVEITYGTDHVSILDNGIGMSPSEVQEDYLRLGRDRRTIVMDEQRHQTTPRGRLVIGNKGIGKLAGFGIAQVMKLRTWREGLQTEVTLDRKLLDESDSLEKIDLPSETSAVAVETSGTEVTLSDWLEGTVLAEESKLRSYLARHLPARPDWKVVVNGSECSAEDIPGERFEISDSIEGFGKVTGFYIIASDRRGLDAGFAIRVRDRIVQEASLFGLNQQTHGYFHLVRIIGEIQADFVDPADGDDADAFVINTSRNGFNPDSGAVQALEAYARSKLESIAGGLQRERSKARKKEALRRNPDFESRLKALGPDVYKRLDETLEAFIAKLSKNEEDKTIDDIVDVVIRYYESDALRIILDSVRRAAPEEAQRLGDMLARYGTAHLAEVTDILHTQMEVINVLREKVTLGVLESEIHSIIAKNIWLLRDDLTYWHDNKAFSTTLASKLAEEFRLDAARRPDLVCFDNRTQQEKSGASPTRLVVVEFKRPGVVIGADELVQVMRYKSIFSASLAEVPSDGIQVIVIGDKFDPAFDRKLFGGDSGYRILSYEELLQNAYHRYSELYDRLAGSQFE